MQGFCLRQIQHAGTKHQIWFAFLAIALWSLTTPGLAQVQVSTQHNDNARTGQNLQEAILTPANVNVQTFGKLWSYAVDGDVYAQPLYVPNVPIPGKGIHNVIYVATEHDSVYALDADSAAEDPLWQTSFINPTGGITTLSDGDVNCDAIAPEIGITSTPVIDPSTNTIYVLAATKEHGSFFHRLHALDITTGAEKFGGPVAIEATYPGTGDGSSGGTLTFDSVMHLNRAGLLMSNGNIYLSWASYCDNPPFHGWVMAYDTTTLQQNGVWVTTPNGGDGGIWMSGAGIAADSSGDLFVATGNGTFESSGSPVDFGDSIVKMTLSGSTFNIIDYFTPFDQQYLDVNDLDLGSGGVLLLPDQPGPHIHELVQAGKEGTIYVVDRDNMGHFNSTDNSQIVQNLTGQIGRLFSTPAYWNNNVFFGGNQDSVKAFSLSNGLLSATPTSSSPTTFSFPGPSPTISANGTSNAILWALQRIRSAPAVLHAYDATNLAHELYNSAQNPTRDNPGNAVKFAVPTVADGKVFVGAVQQVSAYGILPPQTAAPIFSPAGGTYTTTQTVAISDSTPGATIYYTVDGSTPTLASPVYTEPLIASTTTTLKAIAAAAGFLPSSVSWGTYTIGSGGGTAINFGGGFSSGDLVLNGSASLNNSRLRLTDGGPGEIASAWYATKVNIQAFTQDFSFQLTNAEADGMTFAIQNVGANTLGLGGQYLGYGSIPASVAIKFDLYSNQGEGFDSTGLYINGATPTLPAVNMTGSGVDLHSGNVFNVHMTYDGTTLAMKITDVNTQASFVTSWPIDIPGTVGGTTAYVGFTAATGGATAIQEVLSWTFVPQADISYSNGFNPTGMALNGKATLNSSRLRLTDGSPGETASMWYATKVNIQAFTQDFSFQLTNAHGDGMTFAIQNAGTTALGSGGKWLGYSSIPTSVAVKFDLYNNQGEGVDSTGLYINGAIPTVPAVDMRGSGVDLHSGDVFNIHMTYDGITLSMKITDANTQASFVTSWPIDIPGTVGGTTAYVGFTAGTGTATATQEVLNWTFVPQADISYSNGFNSAGMALNGKATLNSSRLRLTDGGQAETASAWYATKVNVQAFTQDFSFQLTNAHGDGMTFAIQNVGTTALGSGGKWLGYSSIPTSVAVKFDLYNNQGEGVDSTGLYINGAIPTVPAVDMAGSGVDLHSGDVFNVHMTYDGITLSMKITDANTQASFVTSWPIDIPGTVGGTTAYAGFTAGTGGATATQEVLNWTFVPLSGINYSGGFTTTGMALNGKATLNSSRLRLTDGGQAETASMWYATKVNIQAFTQDFSFQLTNAHGDGMTFAIQNVGTTALGSGGKWLGYSAIPTSVAVKFDLYNNQGEGVDSTGLYINGAIPTVPAVDMAGSGVDLHSGDVFNVHMTYDGITLSMKITDANTQASFVTSWPIDIPGTVGRTTAYVGFTAGTGGATATQEVLNWTFVPQD